MEQAGIGSAAIGMNAAIAGDNFFPSRFALGVGGAVGKRSAVDLVLVEVDDDLIAIFDEGDRAAECGFRTDVADDKAD